MATLTEEIVPLETTFKHFQVQQSALNDYRSAVISSVGLPANNRYPMFNEMETEEVYDAFASYFRENEYGAILAMCANMEAFIRVDLIEKRRRTGRFRTLYSQTASRTPLDEILDAWYQLGAVHKSWVSKYRGLLNLRHWLAHGRYWNQTIGQDYSPKVVYDIGVDIFRSIVGA